MKFLFTKIMKKKISIIDEILDRGKKYLKEINYFEANIRIYKQWVKEVKDNPTEKYLSLEFENALLIRNGLEKKLSELKEISKFKEYCKEIKEADEILKEALKNPETIRLYMDAINFAKKNKHWWWHPEKINPEALKYLPKDWPKDC